MLINSLEVEAQPNRLGSSNEQYMIIFSNGIRCSTNTWKWWTHFCFDFFSGAGDSSRVFRLLLVGGAAECSLRTIFRDCPSSFSREGSCWRGKRWCSDKLSTGTTVCLFPLSPPSSQFLPSLPQSSLSTLRLLPTLSSLSSFLPSSPFPYLYLKNSCSFLVRCALSTWVHHLWSSTSREKKVTIFHVFLSSLVYQHCSLSYLWNPTPFILSSPVSSISSTDLRRHTSAISCLVRDPWGLTAVEGFRPLVMGRSMSE